MKVKNWNKFNESNTYTYVLLKKNEEEVEIEASDIDDAGKKIVDLYGGTDPMLTHINGELIDWDKATSNFESKETNEGYEDDYEDEDDSDLEMINDNFNIASNALFMIKKISTGSEDLKEINELVVEILEKMKLLDIIKKNS